MLLSHSDSRPLILDTPKPISKNGPPHSSVVQFVDFTTKLISAGTQLYNSSELRSNATAAKSAKYIQDQATTALVDLQDYQFKLREGNTTPSQNLSRDEKRLEDLCSKCTEDAETLIDLLNKLKVPDTVKYRGWTSLAQALSTLWSKKEIDRLTANLQEYRTQINSQVLVSLGSRLDLIAVQSSDRFKSLSSDSQAIISALINLQTTVSGEIQVQLRTLSVLLDRAKVVVADQEDRTRKVIGDVFQHALDFDDRNKVSRNLQRNEQLVRKEVSDDILDSLAFPLIVERFEAVAEAHQKTFEWIFQKPRDIPDTELQDGEPKNNGVTSHIGSSTRTASIG